MKVEKYLREHTDKQRGVNLSMVASHSEVSEVEAGAQLNRLIKAGKVQFTENPGGPYYHYNQAKRGWLLKEEKERR